MACLSAACVSCTRVDPQHAPVAAENVATFATWQRDVAAEFPPDLKPEFADALQEMRFHITAQNEATGHDAIEAVLCQRINARTVEQVLVTGAELKWQRLAAEWDGLQVAINTNANLITKPGDRVAATYLEQTRSQQQQRLDRIAAEIQQVERRLLAHGGTIPAHPAAEKDSGPSQQVSRDEARQQIATMIAERRNPLVLKYGGWPVKIDREGAQLDEAMRSNFSERKKAAELTGKIVIPIRIKGRWLLFEGPNQAPRLPKLIQSSLTPADLRKFEETWVNLEAESWAREAAAGFEIPQPASAPLPSLPPLVPAAPIR